MRLVVDANVLFAALLKDGGTRRLMLQGPFDLFAPAWVWEEVDEYRTLFLQKTGGGQDHEALRQALRARILDVPREKTASSMDQALRLCAADPDDAFYLATCLALDVSLWTHDKALAAAAQAAGIRAWSTRELLVREA